MDSDMSEPAASSEKANRLLSSDMCGPLNDKSDGNTPYAQVDNACLLTGKRPNKTPTFI